MSFIQNLSDKSWLKLQWIILLVFNRGRGSGSVLSAVWRGWFICAIYSESVTEGEIDQQPSCFTSSLQRQDRGCYLFSIKLPGSRFLQYIISHLKQLTTSQQKRYGIAEQDGESDSENHFLQHPIRKVEKNKCSLSNGGRILFKDWAD